MKPEITSKVIDDAREKIADVLQEVALLMETEGKFFCGISKAYTDQILSLLGTTDIECPGCKGKLQLEIVADTKPTGLLVPCNKCNGTGIIKHPWKVRVVLENGELPEKPSWVFPNDPVASYAIAQNDMHQAGYRQVVE